MPLYKYKCEHCGREFRELNSVDDRATCECECGETAKQSVVPTTPTAPTWRPITLEHIADKPMHFKTREELSRYCKDNKVSSGALL